MLKYVVGPSGSGKSTYVFKEVIALAAKQPERNFLIIVPEQFTMVTQRRLVSVSEENCILNVEALSFERLAYRVFDELGSDDRSVLGDTGKMLLLKKAAFMHMDELKVLGRNMKKRGYLDHVKSLISEFEQYRIEPDDLISMSELPGMPRSFADKMSDIRLLYREFLSLLKEKFITSEMVLDMLCEVAGNSSIIRGSYMVFDGYTGFTPVQLALMRRLLTLVDEVVVTATGDYDMPLFGEGDGQELFDMTKKMLSSLNRIAKSEGVEIEEPVRIRGEGKRHEEGSPLSHLEKNIFRPESEKYGKDASGSIKICRLSDPRRELRFVCERIRELVRKEDLRYRDIAIVCADMNDYKGFASGIFERAGIPVFIDERSDIIFDCLLEFLYGAFDVVQYDFGLDGVMRMLRSGLCDLDDRAVDRIENYLRSSGLRGKRAYAHAFARMPGGYDAAMLTAINADMASFREKTVRFYDKIREASVTEDHLEACYELIVSFGIWDQLPDKKLYTFMMDLMDQMYDLLGKEESSFSDFAELFKSGMSEGSVGRIPMTSDSVIFGDIERSRLSDIKVLFLMGAGDRSIPKAGASKGIISQSERLILAENDFELAPTDRERAFMQRFYLYLILTKPSEKLFITYPGLDSSGEAEGPSYLIGLIAELFDLKEISVLDDDPLYWTETKEEAYELLLLYLREYAAGHLPREKEEVLFSLCDYMRQSGEGDRLEKAFESVFFTHTDVAVAREVMDAVYGRIVRISASRLEAYASCAYAYYLRYLLKLKEKREYSFEAADMGNLYHSALENYSRLLGERGLTWHDVTEEEQDNCIDLGIEAAMAEFERAELFDRARERFVADNIRRTLKRSIRALTGQIRAGVFEPKHFEVSLEEIEGAKNLRMRLSDQRTLMLSGKIDRIDTFETEDTVYVKIIDYKSGGKDIDLSAMKAGLQLQLFIYMGAALAAEKKSGKEIKPAGFFYYHIHDPYVEADIGASAEKIEKDIFKELKVKGRVNGDGEIPALLDSEIGEALEKGQSYTSPVIPFSLKKSGETGAGSRALPGEVIDDLISYVSLIEGELGESMAKGRYDIRPYLDGSGRSGCDYCSYHGICGFDERIEGFSKKRIPKFSDEEIIEDIRNKLGEKEDGKKVD